MLCGAKLLHSIKAHSAAWTKNAHFNAQIFRWENGWIMFGISSVFIILARLHRSIAYNFMNTCFVRFMLWDVVCRSEKEQSDLICASSKVVRYFFIARVEFHTWFMNAQSTQSTAKQCWTICCWPNSIPINHIRVFFSKLKLTQNIQDFN